MKAASTLAPASHGLTFLPFLKGERSPGWNDTATACIAGITAQTESKHIFRAGLEAVALRLAVIGSLMGTLLFYADNVVLMSFAIAPFVGSDSVVVGSGTALRSSGLWRQILADALGKDVCMEYDAAESTSKGVAILMGQELPKVFHVGDNRFGAYDVTNPCADAHSVYLSARLQQEQLYHKLLVK